MPPNFVANHHKDGLPSLKQQDLSPAAPTAWAPVRPSFDEIEGQGLAERHLMRRNGMSFGVLSRRGSVRLVGVAALVAAISAIAFAATSPAKSNAKQYVLGVSNTLVGNGWREEMICSIKAQALASGQVNKVIVANRNGGPAEQ